MTGEKDSGNPSKIIISKGTFTAIGKTPEEIVENINKGNWHYHPDCEDDKIYSLPKGYRGVERIEEEMSVPFIPSEDRVLIQRDSEKETIKEGDRIIIPEVSREMPQFATVIAVGEGRYTETGFFVEQRYKPGQRVLVGKFAGSEIKIDDVVYYICQQQEIIGTIPGPEEQVERDFDLPLGQILYEKLTGIADNEDRSPAGAEPVPWDALLGDSKDWYQDAANYMFNLGRAYEQTNPVWKDYLEGKQQARDLRETLKEE